MRPPEPDTFRFDRWLTLAVAAPLAGWRGGARCGAIPILMYHGIGDDLDGERDPYYRTVTSPAAFRRQMGVLKSGGFEALTLSEALRRQHAQPTAERPRRPVVITFDDGLADVRSTAWPVLQEYGFAATVFLSTEHLGGHFITGQPCLAPGEVRELAVQGIEFGSHTVSHPQLASLPLSAVSRELGDSKCLIEDLTGVEVNTFSYPYRFPEEQPRFVRALGGLLHEHGYRAGVTTAIGVAQPRHDPLFLPRVPVNDCDDAEFLRAKLDGAYDWLHAPQLASKRLRSLTRPAWQPLGQDTGAATAPQQAAGDCRP